MVGVVTAALFLALPAGASATTYCVHDPVCSATGTTEPSIQTALDTAGTHLGPDTVKVGPGSYSRMGGYSYASGNGSVALIGAGAGQTKLTNPGNPTNPDNVLVMTSGPKTTVQNLRVILPSDSSFTLFADTGLTLSGASANGVSVTAPSTVVLDTGVDMGGTSSFTNGSVTLPQSSLAPDTAISNRNAGVVSDSALAGANGIQNIGSLTVNRTRILTGSGEGIDDLAGTASVHNSLIYLGSFAGAVGIRAGNPISEAAMVVHADHVTIVGGGPSSTGLQARATAGIDNGQQSVTATLTNSTISGPQTSIDREAQNTSTTNPGTNTANVTTSYSNYAQFKQKNVNGANGAGSTTPDHFVPGTPAFAPGANDFRPAAGSILVDSGDPHFSGGTDLAGDPRVFDGDGDGIAITDLGAYERQ